jgi:hypothetical protein
MMKSVMVAYRKPIGYLQQSIAKLYCAIAVLSCLIVYIHIFAFANIIRTNIIIRCWHVIGTTDRQPCIACLFLCAHYTHHIRQTVMHCLLIFSAHITYTPHHYILYT